MTGVYFPVHWIHLGVPAIQVRASWPNAPDTKVVHNMFAYRTVHQVQISQVSQIRQLCVTGRGSLLKRHLPATFIHTPDLFNQGPWVKIVSVKMIFSGDAFYVSSTGLISNLPGVSNIPLPPPPRRRRISSSATMKRLLHPYSATGV